MRVPQARRRLFRLQFNQSGQTFDYGGLADAWFTDEHWRVRAFAMAKNLDDLLNLFVPSDGGWDFVHARHSIQRDAKMLKIRRQLEFLPLLLVPPLPYIDVSAHLLADCLWLGAQLLKHLNK